MSGLKVTPPSGGMSPSATVAAGVAIAAHDAAADPHTVYQLRSEKNAANGYAPLDSGVLVPVANLPTNTTARAGIVAQAPNDTTKFWRGDATWDVPPGGSLEVKEADGTPDVTGVTQIIVPNSSLTDNTAGSVTLTFPGGSGGALVLLEQHTASGSATLDFTTFISATYDVYLIVMENVLPVTDQVGLQLVASTDGGSTWLGGTSYAFSMLRFNYGTGFGQGSSGTSSIPVDGYASVLAGNTAAYGGVSGLIHLFNPLSATAHKYLTVDDAFRAYEGTLTRITGSGGIYTTSAVNAVRFQFSSGNISSGTIRAYGFLNS